MKLKRDTLLLLLCAFIFVVSCVKDEEEDQIQAPVVTPVVTPAPPSFVVGDTDSMYVVEYGNIIIPISGQHIEYNIDLDNDFENDIRLKSHFIWTGGSFKLNKSSSISPIDYNVTFHAYTKPDTTFYWETETHYTYNSGAVDLIINGMTYCVEQMDTSPDSYVDDIDLLYYKDSSDVISEADEFMLTGSVLSQSTYHTYPQETSQSGDTTIFHMYYYDQTCNNIPENEIKYIVFKKGEKYGWIELKVEESYKVHLIRTAIQM